jgi:hypothetical protein
LSLNKSTIANLNNMQMAQIKGGAEAGNGGDTIDEKDAKTWFLSRCMFSDNRSCCNGGRICSDRD